jgi:ppGpp synthetase/RelA/SpoT-type nucleotidyltranferase
MKELGVFEYSDKVIDILDSMHDDLEIASREIRKYFNKILSNSMKKKIGIHIRIKSEKSLKGKIFRDNYFEKYSEPMDAINNLSDLIGVRVQCKFNSDEKVIYDIFTEHFDLNDENYYYYNSEQPEILLNLDEKQPQIQNNGFMIYKIDGLYCKNDLKMNFEFQIKSLVNVFWSEIEHEIIYKNNNYNIWDNFFEEILGSIKQNLFMIDQQLEILDANFNKIATKDLESRKLALEKNLSQMIYTMFSNKMKNSIGFIVNFNKSCDSIVKYLFRSQGADNLKEYHKTFSKTFSTLNELELIRIDFRKKLFLERKPIFVGEFTKRIGNKILIKIESEFDWVIFFRLLFEIEPGNNVEDFETYLEFLKYRFSATTILAEIGDLFGNEYRSELTEEVLQKICDAFINVDELDFLYDSNLELINNLISDLIEMFIKKTQDFEKFKLNSKVLLYLIGIEIEGCFDKNTEFHQLRQVVRYFIKNSSDDIIVLDDIYRFLNKDNII